MSVPTLTATTNKSQYAPGEAISASWVATDPDNASLTVEFSGHDSQNNLLIVNAAITRVDDFTMDTVKIKDAGGATVGTLTINQAARTASGTVPIA